MLKIASKSLGEILWVACLFLPIWLVRTDWEKIGIRNSSTFGAGCHHIPVSFTEGVFDRRSWLPHVGDDNLLYPAIDEIPSLPVQVPAGIGASNSEAGYHDRLHICKVGVTSVKIFLIVVQDISIRVIERTGCIDGIETMIDLPFIWDPITIPVGLCLRPRSERTPLSC